MYVPRRFIAKVAAADNTGSALPLRALALYWLKIG